MSASNHPVTSREYKLMLNVDRFKDREQGAQIFFGLVEFLIKKAGGTIVEKQNEIEKRRTSYLDTPELALRQYGFALRLREEAKGDEFQINLKYRAPDRYISAAQDLSSPQADKTKFMEKESDWPLVGEFSYDYDLGNSGSDGDKVEMYPRQVVEGANRFFGALQKHAGWMNFDIATKTAFALEVL